MKNFTLGTLFVFYCLLSFGQQLSSEVVATSGDYYESQGYSMSWTIGEPVTATYIKGEEQITHGFQQAFLYEITEIRENGLGDDYLVEVYPNPAELYFNIRFSKEKDKPPLELMLFNTTGSVVYETTIEPNVYIQRVNIHQFASDMFQMVITNKEKSFIRQFKIIKVNK